MGRSFKVARTGQSVPAGPNLQFVASKIMISLLLIFLPTGSPAGYLVNLVRRASVDESNGGEVVGILPRILADIQAACRMTHVDEGWAYTCLVQESMKFMNNDLSVSRIVSRFAPSMTSAVVRTYLRDIGELRLNSAPEHVRSARSMFKHESRAARSRAINMYCLACYGEESAGNRVLEGVQLHKEDVQQRWNTEYEGNPNDNCGKTTFPRESHFDEPLCRICVTRVQLCTELGPREFH